MPQFGVALVPTSAGPAKQPHPMHHQSRTRHLFNNNNNLRHSLATMQDSGIMLNHHLCNSSYKNNSHNNSNNNSNNNRKRIKTTKNRRKKVKWQQFLKRAKGNLKMNLKNGVLAL